MSLKKNLTTTKCFVGKKSEKGELVNVYSPFFNLVNENDNSLNEFATERLNFDREHPVDLLLQDSYDGSVNVILNDDKNNPRLVNSRFSVQEGNTYLIPDHKGQKDTNLYENGEVSFPIDTHLKKIVSTIPTLTFEGLEDGGSMLCGSYSFYFKFADADDNETEVIAESGIVQCHIGEVNTPGKIRMGMESENAEKIIKFKLTNIDPGFDYVKVAYCRNSSDNSQAIVPTYFKIDYKYPVLKSECDVYIRGTEALIQTDISEIMTDYADIDAVKTHAQIDNILFFGNVDKPEHDWEAISTFSRYFRAHPIQNVSIGHLNVNYNDQFVESDPETGYGYYNAKNVYNRVGYWPDEFYRFGVCYIFHDDSISPVFNILGGKISLDESDPYYSYSEVNFEPEDYFYKKELFLNSKGVVKFPKMEQMTPNKIGVLEMKPIGICIKSHYIDPIDQFFKKHRIKGYFFVRQKRIPTVLGQGLVIGKTTKPYGSIPVLKDKNHYVTRGFLQDNRLLKQGKDREVKIELEHCANNALLVPDAELREAAYNQMFVSNEFYVEPSLKCRFDNTESTGVQKYRGIIEDELPEARLTKLTTVVDGTRIITNGELVNGEIPDTCYFSTIAGEASTAFRAVNTTYQWDKTVPQKLTTSTDYVRGKFGPYVGMNHGDFDYGTIVNIKKESFGNDDLDEVDMNEIMTRINDNSTYHAISDRYNASEEHAAKGYDCYRGDCYTSFFTHRMIRNFIDPDLATNSEVVDPTTWIKNYAVRCTCDSKMQPFSNLKKDYTGWWIDEDDDPDSTANTTYHPLRPDEWALDVTPAKTGNLNQSQSFALDVALADPSGGLTPNPWKHIKDIDDPKYETASSYKEGFINEVAHAFELYVGNNKRKRDLMRVVNPESLEKESSGKLIKSIFKNQANWELHGVSDLNRADINSIPVGQWITFPISASTNICMRDIDYSNPTEQALFSRKRSFHPLEPRLGDNHLPDSQIINGAAAISVPAKPRVLIPDVPFFRQEYNDRVYHSDVDSTGRINNAYRVFKEMNYRDYPKKYGSITKLIAFGTNLVCVCEHAILILPVHERIAAGAGVGGDVFVNQKTILPESPTVVSETFGSMWKDSVIATDAAVYGVDTVARKIWKFSSQGLELISDLKLSKFLNHNIDLSEFDKEDYVAHINVKTHYNAFKHDVMFTFYNDIPYDSEGNEIIKLCEHEGPITWERGKTWSLCWNEPRNVFETFYDWTPVESENIDNIYFSFDKEAVDPVWNAKVSTLTHGVTKSSIDKAFSGYVETQYAAANELKRVYTNWLEPTGFKASSWYLRSSADVRVEVYYGATLQDSFILPSTNNEWRFFVKFYHLVSEKSLIEFRFVSDQPFDYCEYKLTQVSIDDAKYRNYLIDIQDPSHPFRDVITINPNEDQRFFELRGNQDFMPIWKHGQAGIYDLEEPIRPTKWYGEQHPFEFEFVVKGQTTAIQEIFNNIKLISNSVAPIKFEFEIDGECYDWSEYKNIIEWINLHSQTQTDFDNLYTEVLTTTYLTLRNKYPDFPLLFDRDSLYIVKKLPYLKLELSNRYGTKNTVPYINTDPKIDSWKDNSSETILVEDEPLSEKRVRIQQLANDMKKYGRLRGNMEYLEDLWDIEIRPIAFKFAYIADGKLAFTEQKEMRLRDKYLRVKMKYDGKDLALIQGAITKINESFA